MKKLCFALLLLLAAAPVTAQPAQQFASDADIKALIAKAKAMPPQPVISLPVVSVGPQKVQLDYRTGPGVAAAHKDEDELIWVVEGSGTIYLGGKIVDPTKLDGATPRRMAKGDVLFIPLNTPHQLIPDSGKPWALMAFHVGRPAPR